ncbi:TPA: staphylokinase, partial [Staphylococcus aureus]|nr:staphylokinase [Staphylococcus aureus]
MLKRGLLFLTVLLLLFSFSSITNEVSASSSFDKGKYKKGDDASYFEPTGPYLMVNVTGVDGKGNELLSPHYVEFPIKPGTTLTKEKIEYYVEWALDATAYK